MRWNEPPAHQRQFTDRFLRILTDDGNRLGSVDVWPLLYTTEGPGISQLVVLTVIACVITTFLESLRQNLSQRLDGAFTDTFEHRCQLAIFQTVNVWSACLHISPLWSGRSSASTIESSK